MAAKADNWANSRLARPAPDSLPGPSGRAGIPLSVHPQTIHDAQYGIRGGMGAGCERLEKYSYVYLTAFTFELMIALMHMIEGAFDRYPKLKVAYMEGSCGWLPFWTERLDEHFTKLRPQWRLCQRKPSEIIKAGRSP